MAESSINCVPCKISQLKPKLKGWKVEVFFKKFTSEVGETHYENRTLTGRRCVFELRDDSGRIDLVAFDEDVKKLESFELKTDTKYCIWGAEVHLAKKEFAYPNRKHELRFNEKTNIKPVKGGLSLREIKTPHRGVATKDPKPTNFEPTPMMNIDVGKPKLPFNVLGILQETSELKRKQNRKSGKEFLTIRLTLIDTTGTVDVYVIGKEEQLNELTELQGKVIGLVGCIWKKYGKVNIISSYWSKVFKEEDLPENTRDTVKVLKEIWEKRGTTSEKKKTKSKKRSKAEGLTEDMEKLHVNK